jgi:hypothetical protein
MPRSSRVRTTSRNFGSIVRLTDPDYDRERRVAVEYDFRPQGGRLFTGDPAKRGVYAPEG